MEDLESNKTDACSPESMFENTCTCTETIWNELCLKQARTRFVRTLCIDIIVILLLGFYAYLTYDFFYVIVITSFCIVLNLVECLYLPRRQAKMAYRRAMDLYHTEQSYQTFFYPDYIFLKNVQSKGEVKITYDKIAALLDTRQTYLLQLKQKTYLLIKKDGFTKGSMLDFVNFIQSKEIPRKF
ncbi:MAG: YcxB family protein [Clostridiales bacterium]|nr:YcxB family protein [Clostridiales bacterium]